MNHTKARASDRVPPGGSLLSMPILSGDLTLLDLILVVQEFAATDDETVQVVCSLIESGRIRLRTPLAVTPTGFH